MECPSSSSIRGSSNFTRRAKLVKSVSVSETFKVTKREEFEKKLKERSQELAQRLEKYQLCGNSLTLLLKNTKFQYYNKNICLKCCIWKEEDIYI